MTDHQRPRAVGINHVALEVNDVDETLGFLEGLFAFSLRARDRDKAFIELGDQFIGLFRTDAVARDDHRHFGLVVDDKEEVERRLLEQGVELLNDRFLDFLDPSGNRWQVVEYADIEFMKQPDVLEFLGVSATKSQDALQALQEKGIRPEQESEHAE